VAHEVSHELSGTVVTAASLKAARVAVINTRYAVLLIYNITPYARTVYSDRHTTDTAVLGHLLALVLLV
jgi:hypothetical protein